MLAAAEAEKEAHYVDTPPPFEFHAFAAGLETNLGPSATALLRKLSASIALRQNGGHEPSDRLRSAVWRRTRARVGRAIMAQLAWQASTAFVASPHAALPRARRYVHSAWRPLSSTCTACVCGASSQDGEAARACCCNAQRA